MTVPFTVIYHDGKKYRHKQIRGLHAMIVSDDFEKSNPKFTIKEVFCGSLRKIHDAEFQKICKECYESQKRRKNE